MWGGMLFGKICWDYSQDQNAPVCTYKHKAENFTISSTKVALQYGGGVVICNRIQIVVHPI